MVAFCAAASTLVYIVENNGVYGLTKGQFSATADKGNKSKRGAVNSDEPIDLLMLALTLAPAPGSHRQAGEIERRQAIGEMDFDADQRRVHAVERTGVDDRDSHSAMIHYSSLPGRTGFAGLPSFDQRVFRSKRDRASQSRDPLDFPPHLATP